MCVNGARHELGNEVAHVDAWQCQFAFSKALSEYASLAPQFTERAIKTVMLAQVCAVCICHAAVPNVPVLSPSHACPYNNSSRMFFPCCAAGSQVL